MRVLINLMAIAAIFMGFYVGGAIADSIFWNFEAAGQWVESTCRIENGAWSENEGDVTLYWDCAAVTYILAGSPHLVLGLLGAITSVVLYVPINGYIWRKEKEAERKKNS